MNLQTSALLLSWLAILVLAFAVAGIVRQLRIMVRMLPSESGSGYRPYPQIELAQPTAVRVLLFLAPGCRACRTLLPSLPRLMARLNALDGEVDMVAVFAGEAPNELGVPVLANRGDLFQAFRVSVTPFAVARTSDGRVIRSMAVGSVRVLEDLVEAASSSSGRIGLSASQP